MTRPVSDCHAASLEEAGADHTITYWVCRECGEPCDPAVTLV
jgi:hypothetical protein